MEVFFPGGLMASIAVMSMCSAIAPGQAPSQLRLYGKCVNEYANCVEAGILPKKCVDKLERRLKDRSFFLDNCKGALN